MTIVTSYPGVYISEDASLSLTLAHTATAVPVFIHDAAIPNAPDQITRFVSWPEVQALGVPVSHPIYTTLKLWFGLSGGPCYIAESSQLLNLNAFDEISLLVANGTQDVADNLVALCEAGKGRFALLDGPRDRIDGAKDVMKDYPQSAFAAAWYPWLTVSWSEMRVPPSVAAAIGISITDRSRGVWKAPANVVINGLTPVFPVTDELQGTVNSGKALNMIRSFPNKGTTLWGARTLDDSDRWRYISVRRLFNSIEKDVKRMLTVALFEDNSQPTWQLVRAAIDNYFHNLWQKGALAGDRPSDAWFVRIGEGTTMSMDDIKQGRMVIDMGVAAVRPAEFIVLNLSQSINR